LFSFFIKQPITSLKQCYEIFLIASHASYKKATTGAPLRKAPIAPPIISPRRKLQYEIPRVPNAVKLAIEQSLI
jgi:hypothetical protein